MDWGKKRFCQAATRSHQISESIENGVLFLAAHWKPCGLELYDTGSWSQPEVDPSASEQAMAGASLYTFPAILNIIVLVFCSYSYDYDDDDDDTFCNS